MVENTPDKARFEQAYDGKAPWGIGKPQPVFVRAASQITGSVLDVGCGTDMGLIERAPTVTPNAIAPSLVEPLNSWIAATGCTLILWSGENRRPTGGTTGLVRRTWSCPCLPIS
jgi:hypothetical protein